MELYLIVQSGITLNEGLLLLAEDENDESVKNILKNIYDRIDVGTDITTAFSADGVFPSYMVNMIGIGERTGRLDSVFRALSLYYDRQVAISRTIKSAVVYPSILFAMMLAVIAVLVIMVLPIFNNVFTQLGSTMSPLAQAFMNFGAALSSGRWVILAVVAVILILCLLIRFLPSMRKRFALFSGNIFAKMTLGKKTGRARFASALAMTLASGLDIDSSMEMAQKLCGDSPIANNVQKCRDLVKDGMPFADAIAEMSLFDPIYCRMLSIGVKTGSADLVMDDIARRSEEAVEIAIEKTIGKVEPILVVAMSFLVGLVLLSVMLPLMDIMSSIG